MQLLHSSIEVSPIVHLQQSPIFNPTDNAVHPPQLKETDMTTMISSKSATVGARVANFFNGLRARRAQYAVYRNTIRELEGLSTRELNDLGINSGSIRAIAYQAAYEG